MKKNLNNSVKVDFILLSEFHLEKGNIISSYYPNTLKLPIDEELSNTLPGKFFKLF